MNTKPSFLIACLLTAFSAIACFTQEACAQGRLPTPTPIPSVSPLPSPTAPPSPIFRTDDSLNAVITYGGGHVVRPGSCRGVTNRLGLDPGQIVTITLNFPINRGGQSVAVEPLDGGIVTASSAALSNAGVVQFQFQANREPGLTQVRVGLGTEEYGLQFYVFDPNHPAANPHIPKLDGIESLHASALQSQSPDRDATPRIIPPERREAQ